MFNLTHNNRVPMSIDTGMPVSALAANPERNLLVAAGPDGTCRRVNRCDFGCAALGRTPAQPHPYMSCVETNRDTSVGILLRSMLHLLSC
jgi:hypothetical protein